MTHNPTTRYRKLPVEIEARQLTAESYREFIESLTVEEFAAGGEAADGTAFLEIRTLEGVMRASEGDWIIRGVKGELYPCRDDIFRATYEPAAVPSAVDRAGLHDLIAEALREHGMVHLGDQVPADEYDCCADAVLAKLPQPAARAAVLREAADALDAKLAELFADWPSEPMDSPGVHSWREAIAELRRLADEAEHEETVRCPLCADARVLDTPAEAREHFTTVHPEERLVGSGPWPLLANRADEAQQQADTETRPHCPHCQLPHDLEPGSLPVAACESIRARIAEAGHRHAEDDHGGCAAVDCEVALLRLTLDAVEEGRRELRSDNARLRSQLWTLTAIFEGFARLLATSSRDWGQYAPDAWLYAVICGWDCEEPVHDETCTHGAMEEMQQRHGWDDETVAKARRYRAAVRAVVESGKEA